MVISVVLHFELLPLLKGKKLKLNLWAFVIFPLLVCLPIQVADVYKRPNSELSHAKASLEEASQISENKGVQLLGQIKNSSSRPRAILFKLLADAVGLESQLVVVSWELIFACTFLLIFKKIRTKHCLATCYYELLLPFLSFPYLFIFYLL